MRRTSLPPDVAAAAGAELHAGEKVVRATADSTHVAVVTERGAYAARALLVATGAEGALRAGIGLPPPAASMAAALEIEAPAVAPSLHPERIVFDFFPGGYAWAFAKGETWNAGVIAAWRTVGPRLREMLAAFLARIELRFESDSDTDARPRGRRIPMHG